MSKTYDEIKDLMEMFDDLPDGAFFAVMEEHGVSIEDMEAIGDRLTKDWAAKPKKEDADE